MNWEYETLKESLLFALVKEKISSVHQAANSLKEFFGEKALNEMAHFKWDGGYWESLADFVTSSIVQPNAMLAVLKEEGYDLNASGQRSPYAYVDEAHFPLLHQLGADPNHAYSNPQASSKDVPWTIVGKILPESPLLEAAQNADAKRISALIKVGARTDDEQARLSVLACVGGPALEEDKWKSLCALKDGGIDLFWKEKRNTKPAILEVPKEDNLQAELAYMFFINTEYESILTRYNALLSKRNAFNRSFNNKNETKPNDKMEKSLPPLDKMEKPLPQLSLNRNEVNVLLRSMNNGTARRILVSAVREAKQKGE